MSDESVLGLDIGGANLKAATADGTARTVPFELWKYPHRLSAELRKLIAQFPDGDRLAVTMTGELCDCFPIKREGVEHILRAINEAASDTPTRIWLTDGRLVDPTEAISVPHLVAASNWHALATCVGETLCKNLHGSLLIDVGSTTTDIIPIQDGIPTPRGKTDEERLLTSELIYFGVRRTPVCALPIASTICAESFATVLDVYLVLGMIPEDVTDTDTADGRPTTVEHAHARLARMLGGDRETIPVTRSRELAEECCRVQRDRMIHHLGRIVREMASSPSVIVLSGSGEFLARAALDEAENLPGTEVVSLRDQWGISASIAAPATALAKLAERLWPDEQ